MLISCVLHLSPCPGHTDAGLREDLGEIPSWMPVYLTSDRRSFHGANKLSHRSLPLDGRTRQTRTLSTFRTSRGGVSDSPSSSGWSFLHAMSLHFEFISGSGSSTFRKEEIAFLNLNLAVWGMSDPMHTLTVPCSLVAYIMRCSYYTLCAEGIPYFSGMRLEAQEVRLR
jgi:hypothetical protein